MFWQGQGRKQVLDAPAECSAYQTFTKFCTTYDPPVSKTNLSYRASLSFAARRVAYPCKRRWMMLSSRSTSFYNVLRDCMYYKEGCPSMHCPVYMQRSVSCGTYGEDSHPQWSSSALTT
eukprot:12855705-Prorocentrum_lima.AAC.1